MAEPVNESFEVNLDIGNCTMNVDIAKTKQWYTRQIKVTDNCTCEDCQHYMTVLINDNLGILKILSSVGVDLEKNIGIPPGFWVVKDEGKFCYCQQQFRLHGTIISKGVSKIDYIKEEQGMEIRANIAQYDMENIDIYLTIEMKRNV